MTKKDTGLESLVEKLTPEQKQKLTQRLEQEQQAEELQKAIAAEFQEFLTRIKAQGYNISVNSITLQGGILRFDPKQIGVAFTLIDVPPVALPVPESEPQK